MALRAMLPRPVKRQTSAPPVVATKAPRLDGRMEEEQWECAKCGNMNYGSRVMCNMRSCGAPRSEEPWTCPSCGSENHATRLFCNLKQCQVARPGLTAAALLQAERQQGGIQGLMSSASLPSPVSRFSRAPATGGGIGQTPPAWTCTYCGNSNFAGRTNCNSRKCGAPYSVAGPKALMNGGSGGSQLNPKLPWPPICSAHFGVISPTMWRVSYVNLLVIAFPSAVAAGGLHSQFDGPLLLQARGEVVTYRGVSVDDEEAWMSEDEIKIQYTSEELNHMIDSGDVVTKTLYRVVAEQAEAQSALRTDQVPLFGGGQSPETTTSEPAAPTTTAAPVVTTTPDCAKTGTCSIYEDPHVRVFDGAQISLLGSSGTRTQMLTREDSGDMWLVRSSEISIQGRYLPDPDLPEGNLFVRAIAVGGPFLKGSTLIAGPLEEQITWNGEPILETQTSDFYAEGMHAKRHTKSHLVQDMTQTNAGLDIDLPHGVKLTVNRMKKHVNVFIEMPPASGGQEGLCGNFNCNAADDEMHMILANRSPKVMLDDSLFEQ